MNTKTTHDFVIVGAGIIGLTTAYELSKVFPKSSIAIFEKEAQEGFHASGRNSGVLHTGIYYGSDSKKARFCLNGNRMMKEFCAENGLPINESGKLVVTKDEHEIAELKRLYFLGK